ncbi:replication protein P [Aliidiomarina sp. Khilg15.8]
MAELLPVLLTNTTDFADKHGKRRHEVLRIWAYQICVAGLGEKDVARGIHRLLTNSDRKKIWAPLPHEFIAMCKPTPEEMGLPSMEAVANELEQNLSWNRRHGSKQFVHSHRLVELIAREMLPRYRMADQAKRDKLLERSYTKWLEVARKSGLPAKMSAIADIAEPRPIVEEYLAKNGKVKIDSSMAQRLSAIGRNLRERRKTA